MSPSLPLIMGGLPDLLRAQPWIGWRRQGGRKDPFQIGAPNRLAANNNPSHWRGEGDVAEVIALAPEVFDGFGIVLTPLARITFIDLDHVIEPDSGAVEPWAMQMVTTFDSFTEASQSGTGLHIFVRGQLPGRDGIVGYLDGNPARKVEVYSERRYAYVTGHSLGPPRSLAERQRLVTLLAQHVRPAGARMSNFARDDDPIPEGQRNDALFRIARGFVRHGLRGQALKAALLAVNARRCIPALPNVEVVKLAQHAERLPDRRPA